MGLNHGAESGLWMYYAMDCWIIGIQIIYKYSMKDCSRDFWALALADFW